MKMLRIHCANCKGFGRINHPAEMICPFCNGYGSKEIFYSDSSSKSRKVKP